jgi:Tol biopolymer transport system component
MRTLPPGSLTHIEAVTWFPDGRRVVLAGSEGARPTRLYVQDVSQGEPRAISGEQIRIPYPCRAVSPDGRSIVAIGADGRLLIQPAEGGATRPVPGLQAGDVPIRWSGDAGSLYVFRKSDTPARIIRVDVGSGRLSRVADLVPSDRAGTKPPIAVQMTPDGRVYVYTYSQTVSDLYLVQGL